jgi:uncharacterized membrane protein
MAEPEDLKALRAALESLQKEVGSLRSEVAALKGDKKPDAYGLPSAAAPAPVAVSAPVSAAPKPASKGPLAEKTRFCEACHSRLEKDDEFCDQCGHALGIKKAPPKEAPKPAPAAAAPAAPAAPKLSLERFIGEKLLHYVGMLLLALGAVFFLVWRAAHTGPGERVFMAAAAGAVLIAAGQWARRNPPYDQLAQTLIGGGWTILYLTAYGAYHFEATKILQSAFVEVLALVAVAVGMTAHGLSLASRPFRLYGFGLTFFVFFLARQEMPSFEMFLLLLTGSALVAAATGEADILLVTIPGYYLNYLPVYWAVILTQAPDRTLANFLRPFSWLLGAYALIAALPLIPAARRKLFAQPQLKLADAALCLNALLFAAIAGSMGRAYFGEASLQRCLMMSLLFVVPAFAYLRLLPKTSAISNILPVIALALVCAGIFNLPDPLWKMLAWIAAAAAWVWIGLLVDHGAWRLAGLFMACMSFGFYFHLAGLGPEQKRAASLAMLAFSGLSYLFSRFYRLWLKGKTLAWEEPALEYWLYMGTVGLLLALWGLLRPAPLAVALIGCALLGELAAARFGRLHLWAQACALSLAAAVYSMAVDHGANVPLAGFITPRLLTSGCVAAGLACLIYADPTPRSFTKPWTAWTHEGHRGAASWALFAVLAFLAYQELGARTRLPVWAAAAVLHYWAGRARGDGSLRRQGLLLAGFAAWDAVFGYLHAPSVLLAESTRTTAFFYLVSSGALLGGLIVARDVSFGPITEDDFGAGWVFALAPIVMIAAFCAKEMDRLKLTMAWTAEGAVLLTLGLALGLRELRIPSLGLLGVCVAKALLVDLAGLPLPYRVASFVALGAALLFASTLYVRSGKDVG